MDNPSPDSIDKEGEDRKETDYETQPKEATSIDEKENQDEDPNKEQQALIEELEKIESEIKSLRDVLASKQKRAAEIKHILGNPIVNDVKERLKSIQDSEALQKTNQAFKSAGEKTSAAFSNIGRRFVDVRTRIGVSLGSSINNVKARMNTGNRSEGVLVQNGQSNTGSLTTTTIDEEDISLYEDLDDSPYD